MRSPDVKGSLNQKLPPQPLLAPVSRYSSKNTILAKCWLNYLIFNYSTVRWWARLLRRGKFCSEFLCILMSCCIEWMRTKPIFLPSFFSPMPMPPMSSSCARETWHDGWLSLLFSLKKYLVKKSLSYRPIYIVVNPSEEAWDNFGRVWSVSSHNVRTDASCLPNLLWFFVPFEATSKQIWQQLWHMQDLVL